MARPFSTLRELSRHREDVMEGRARARFRKRISPLQWGSSTYGTASTGTSRVAVGNDFSLHRGKGGLLIVGYTCLQTLGGACGCAAFTRTAVTVSTVGSELWLRPG